MKQTNIQLTVLKVIKGYYAMSVSQMVMSSMKELVTTCAQSAQTLL